MTTPQETLFRIKDEIKQLRKAFYREHDEQTYCIFDDIGDIRKNNELIIHDMRKLNETMALILSVLNQINNKGNDNG